MRITPHDVALKVEHTLTKQIKSRNAGKVTFVVNCSSGGIGDVTLGYEGKMQFDHEKIQTLKGG